MAGDNRTLGRFHLVGIPPAPRGVPQIEVTFDIDANGITHVSAKDLGTGKEQKITITGSGGLADDEIKRMVSDAQAHSTEDKKRREQVETRNRLDSLIYSTEKTFEEHKEKLSAEDVGALEAAITDGKTALEGQDVDAMKSAEEKITQASHKLAEAMYRSTQSTADDGGQAKEESPQDSDVIDAEFVDVDK